MKIIDELRRALFSQRFRIAMVVSVLSLYGRAVAQNAPATTSSGPNAVSPLIRLAIKPAVPYAATPLPLADVRLTGGPLKRAQDLDAEYLLKLEPDRMLYFLRLRAGLMPKSNEHDGGWDGDGRQLTGHIAGHYLSAVSYMYAATGDSHFKDRVDYIVDELRDVQNRHGDGYIGALLGNMGRGGGASGRPRQSATRRWENSIPATREGDDSIVRVRSEWHVVAVVRRAQVVRRVAGCVSDRGQSDSA